MDGFYEMTERHHYRECGLDYVYLLNGFNIEDGPYGPGVAIEKADQLHDVIALDVVRSPRALRGQEVRFLRSILDVSQAGLGDILGKSRATVARWEAARNEPVPGPDDRLVRIIYALKAHQHEAVEQILDLLSRIDELEHQNAEFEDTARGWTKKAA